MWGALLGGGSFGGAEPVLKPPPPRLISPSCPRTSCLPPVGGAGKAAKPRPLPCVLDPEGWRERALRGLGQISILSWKLRIQSVHTHSHPRIGLLQPRGVCRAREAPRPDTVGQSVKAIVVIILFQFVGWGQGSWKQSVEETEMGAPFCPYIDSVSAWRLGRQRRGCASPFLSSGTPFPLASVLHPSLLSTLSLDNKRDSSGREGIASSPLPGV